VCVRPTIIIIMIVIIKNEQKLRFFLKSTMSICVKRTNRSVTIISILGSYNHYWYNRFKNKAITIGNGENILFDFETDILYMNTTPAVYGDAICAPPFMQSDTYTLPGGTLWRRRYTFSISTDALLPLFGVGMGSLRGWKSSVSVRDWTRSHMVQSP